MTLEQVIADARGDAQVLRRRGHVRDAELIERLCDDVAAAADAYLRWLSETEARLQSGWGIARLRKSFPEWLAADNARWQGRQRQYRALVVPHRANVASARELGRRVAHGLAS